MLKLFSTDDDRQQPWEYLPAGAITPKYGMALRINAGVLALASGIQAPEYVSMRQEEASVSAGDIIPVIKVHPDQIWETEAPSASLTVGVKYTLAADGMSITSTSTSGVATVIAQDPSDYTVRVRFQ